MGANISRNDITQIQEIVNNIVYNVINQNKFTVSNVISNNQKVTIRNGPTGRILCKGGLGGLQINQNINSTLKSVNTASSSVMNQLTTELQSALVSKIDQFMKGAYETLGNVFTVNDQRNSIYLRQSILNYIETNITNEFLVSIINSVVNVQDAEIINDGLIEGDDCIINQDILVKLESEAISNSIVNNAVSNKAISTASSIIKQDNEIKVKGLQSIFGNIVAIIIVFILCGGLVVKSFTNWKFLLVVFAIIIIYLITAFFVNWIPFKKRQYWGCERLSGTDRITPINTGRCIRYNNSKDGPYESEEVCMSNIGLTCPQFYGCKRCNDPSQSYTEAEKQICRTKKFTGSCTKYNNPRQGNFINDLVGCNIAISQRKACCDNCWACTTKGEECKNIPNPMDYKDPTDPNKEIQTYEIKSDCDRLCQEEE